jgi:hypothetical protein
MSALPLRDSRERLFLKQSKAVACDDVRAAMAPLHRRCQPPYW